MALPKVKRGESLGTLETLHDELSNILSAPFNGFSLLKARWSLPSTDVWEDNDNIYVEADMPGLESRDIDVSVNEENVLTISGKKEKSQEKEGKDFYRSERYYGEYYREIALPKPVDASKVKAKTASGVLKITLPKKEEAREKMTKIKVE